LAEYSTGVGEYNSHQAFSGKIAVITGDASANKDDFNSAKLLAAKYGSAKIIHIERQSESLGNDFAGREKQFIDTVTALAADREIRALIFNQAYPGSNAAVDVLKETRDDIFVVYCSPHEPILEAAKHADLILRPNELKMGRAMAEQAKKQGAKVFVHYSFPRHMAISFVIDRRDLIRETCTALGIKFVDAAAPDPRGEIGAAAARQFILEDVPKLAAMYGEDTAFFCTNCALQTPLIKAVLDCHAIFPQPCCPSLYHGFPEALGIEIGEGQADLSYLISEACRIAAEKNMTDRLSTWPVSASMMFTNAGAEYAIRWSNGEVPKTGIENKVLLNCIDSYVTEVVGEESNVYMDSYSENGAVYDNYKIILMSYLDL
jgi:hypothetical protein